MRERFPCARGFSSLRLSSRLELFIRGRVRTFCDAYVKNAMIDVHQAISLDCGFHGN